LFMFLLSGKSAIRNQTSELAELKSKISHVKTDTNKTRPGLEATTAMMRKIVDDLQARKNSPIGILEQLSEGLPRSCWLSELRFEAGKTIVLRGSALSNSAVADAVQFLSNSPRFQSVSPDYSNLSHNPGSSSYDFQIKSTLPPSAALIQSPKGKTVKTKAVVQ
jgi:Tfp pilus assembly protein PilN